MIIKLLTNVINDDSSGNRTVSQVEEVIECTSYTITFHPEEPDKVWLRTSESNNSNHHVVDKNNSSMYVCNNDGKTIESYRWREYMDVDKSSA